MSKGKFQIMELFGPTIQGEGLMTGTVTHFIRFGGCGLRCTWCDSMFAVDPKQIKEHRTLMGSDELLAKLRDLPPAPFVTLTGGDPCLVKNMGDIIPSINYMGMRIAVETQGMLFPDWLEMVDVITFSPKGPSSGNVVDHAEMADWIVKRGPRTPYRICIKVVVFDEADYRYAMNIYDSIPEQFYDAFYFTAGTDITQPSPLEKTVHVIKAEQQLAAFMLNSGTRFNEKVHLGCQQHVLLWPDKDKGV